MITKLISENIYIYTKNTQRKSKGKGLELVD